MSHNRRPSADAVIGSGFEGLQLSLKVANRLVRTLPVDVWFRWQIPDPSTDSASNTHLLQTVNDLIEKTNRPGFQKCCSSGLEHLHRGQYR